MHKFILLGVLPALALARRTPMSPIFRRTYETAETCEELGKQWCGSGCIPLDYTCCSQEQGGCPADQYCVTGSDGDDGCCLNDEVCSGPGSVLTTTFTATTSSSVAEDTPSETPATTDDAATATSADDATTATEDATSATETEDATSTEETGATSTSEADSSSTTSASDSDATSTETASSTASISESLTSSISLNSTTTGSPISNSTTTPPANSLTTSTIYATTTKTITSCPAHSGGCHGSNTPTVILVTETIAISTTVCPITQHPSTPTPTTTPHIPGAIIPIVKPTIVCPGKGNGSCYPVAPSSSSSSSTVAQPQPTKPTTAVVVVVPTGTGSYHTSATASATKGISTVVPGAATKAGMGMGIAVGLAGFAVMAGL